MSDPLQGFRLGWSRRDWLKASGLACGASAAARLGSATVAANDDMSNVAAGLRNPEQQAGTDRIKHDLRRCRELALAELKPSRKHIDRALSLHAESIVCDPMGGSLNSGGLFSPELDKVAIAELARLRADGNGSINGKQMDQISNKTDEFRPFELVSNQLMQRDHQAILQASGRTLSTMGAEPWTAPGSNLDWHTYLLENLDYMEKVTRPEQAA